MRAIASMGNKVILYINSDGGEVDEGWAVVQAIKDAEANTHVVGRAGSMSGMALLFGKHRTMNEFARIHLHGASRPDGKLDAAVTHMNEAFKAVLEQTTKLSEDQIDKILQARGAKSVMFDAKEALKYGLVDEIIPSKSEMRVAELDEKELYVAYASLNNVEPKKAKSMKEVNLILGLVAEASEATVVEAINKLKANATTAETKVTELEAEVKELKQENAKFKKDAEVALEASIKTILDEAENSKKITAEARPKWEAQLKTNFEGTKELLEGLSGASTPASATADISQSAGASAGGKITDFTPEACHGVIMNGTIEAYSAEEQDKILEGYTEYNKNPKKD